MTIDVRKFLHDARHMIVAVIDESGEPWAVPVGIRSYDAGQFEWVSMDDTLHSKAIERNEHIAVTVFYGSADASENFGFYAKAIAKKSADLGGGAAIYQAQCTEAWYNDHTRIKTNIDIKDI